MITPLDYRGFCLPPAMTFRFSGHIGATMSASRATFNEDVGRNCISYYVAPKAQRHSGCDDGYADGDDGTFDVLFAIRIDRPNRRFSS